MNTSKIDKIDSLRGVAIISVFLYHVYLRMFGLGHLPFNGLLRNYALAPSNSFYFLNILSYGNLGVVLFFIVSGFCIHFSFLKYAEATNLIISKPWLFRYSKAFYLRRFFRIFPAYIVLLVIFSYLPPFERLQLTTIGFYQFITHALLIQNLDKITFFGINGAFWSIAVEWQLYLIYPLLLKIRQLYGMNKAIVVIAIFTLVYKSFSAQFTDLYIISRSPFQYWITWSLGAVIAENTFNNKKTFNVRNGYLLLLVVIVVVFDQIQPFLLLNELLAPIVIAIAMDKYLQSNNINKFEKVFIKIGLPSYSIYLMHGPVLTEIILFLDKYLKSDFVMIFLLKSIVAFIPIFGLALISYKLIELPLQKMGSVIAKRI